jgi:hypothetical protein
VGKLAVVAPLVRQVPDAGSAQTSAVVGIADLPTIWPVLWVYSGKKTEPAVTRAAPFAAITRLK